MDRCLAAGRLIEQGGNGDGGRTADTEIVLEIVQRDAAVENVLDEDDVAALDVLIQVLVDLHGAGGRGLVAVGRHGHEIDRARNGDAAHQVGHEHKAALEHADEQRLTAVKIPGNLGTQLRRARLDLLGGQQNGRNVISHIAHSILPHMSGSVPLGHKSWFDPAPPPIARQRRSRRWPPAHPPRG